MRYAHGGGLTPKEQEKRERVRLEAVERFARGEKTEAVARELRVTSRSVRRWRREWEEGGAAALGSKGPASVERLNPRQWGGWSGSGSAARSRTAGTTSSWGGR
uniref:helix-turn-helix domain-containing protein n=1 Tax=Streptomyces lycii TaxID=2654337 RepID=UPI002E2773E6